MTELDENITLLINAQLNGTATQSELDELEQWLKSDLSHKKMYAEVKAILSTKTISFTEQETEMAFARVEKLIGSQTKNSFAPTKKIKTIFPYKTMIGIAASILLVIVLYQWSAKNWDKNDSVAIITKDCPKGEKLHLSLSDGTEVWLNSGSHFNFPEYFDKKNRVVNLEGEAFFHVAKNEHKPFIVNTSNSKIEVLGTSFNVSTRNIDNITETTVVSGKVLVSSTFNNESVTLIKNQYVLVDSKGKLFKKENINIESIVDWKDNNLYFNNVPLSEVFKEIEPWFDIEITVKDKMLYQKKLRAKFSNPSLNQFLDYTSKVMGFEYHKDGKTVTIKKHR